MKTTVKEQHFIKLALHNGEEATYIAERASNDKNGNPRYNVTIVYSNYAEMSVKPVTSYNIIETIKQHHAEMLDKTSPQ